MRAAATAVRARALGLGARTLLAPGARGRVVASFPRACYLALPGGLVALVGPDVHPGPIHVLLDANPEGAPVGAPAAVAGGAVRAGRLRVEAEGAPTWRGALPPPAAVRRAAARIAALTAWAARRSLAAPGAVAAAARALGRGDLTAAAGALVGRGPGLTPSGDDVLAGILLALRAGAGPSSEARTVPVAEGARTTAVSRAFLRWAARGQGLAPVHDLLVAGAAGDAERARSAAAALARVGESSGADLALGLRLGLEAVAPGAGAPRC